jgi:hypothetical protein
MFCNTNIYFREGVPEGGNMQSMIYNGTQSRATPYLCGILFGYYLYYNHNKKVNISKVKILTN